MRVALCTCITIAVILILAFEWRKLKDKPRREKAALFAVLLLVWALSMLDLPATPGPVTLLEMIFKPFEGLIKP
ncbi:multisubunit Na+/H+ antiporter MnhB subunit [Paenibacillus phyllosphaerae]|uniref:Multisubunit Na+/H+ antiporter MnhB subunit n=1 Tax=Paenibacillus phyllosphaerae TaxID=274593 RepID=A0A7W5AZR9_9BACL|nr:hypothetical protein [Paenibacillus phyllosphaerae]MBB3111743.1 multisubunit Na+/H+ antiporter MnhB subunit [Paenibacillus phyllosphaerae]